ncbi:MAG: putative collagen-binding domain-containing protein [Chthonomonadales bacterium]
MWAVGSGRKAGAGYAAVMPRVMGRRSLFVPARAMPGAPIRLVILPADPGSAGGLEAVLRFRQRRRHMRLCSLQTYLPQGDSVTLRLSRMRGVLRIWWFDPRKGSLREGGRTLGGARSTLVAPDTRDWVLLVQRR